MGDWIIWLMLTQNGLIHNFEERMAVYRMHHNGVWIGKGKEKNLKDMIAAYNILTVKLDSKNKKDLKKGAKGYYYQLLNILADKKSSEIFYWTRIAFFRYYDIRQFRYLIRYFRNMLRFNRVSTSPVN